MKEFMAGDTVQHKVTGKCGRAMSSEKKDGTISVKPAFRSQTEQWQVSDVRNLTNEHGGGI